MTQRRWITIPHNQKPEKKKQSLPLNARAMGIYILGSRGSGKSRLSGRVIAWQDYRAEIPLVVIDPLGGTIDNFFDKLFRFLQYVHPTKPLSIGLASATWI
jgi:hypothetical protein